MIAFADASALVKRYIPEPGADELESFEALFVSSLSRVEAMSAVARGRRDGRISGGHAPTLVAAIEGEFDEAEAGRGDLAPIAVDARILHHASGLVASHTLRAGDAIHLASALSARAIDPRCEAFVCFDDRLRSAAASEGFHVLPAARP